MCHRNRLKMRLLDPSVDVGESCSLSVYWSERVNKMCGNPVAEACIAGVSLCVSWLCVYISRGGLETIKHEVSCRVIDKV